MRSTRRLKHELNVVPYIDVMLVLLVIFMVAAPLMNQSNIDLPSVSKSDVNNKQGHIEIQLSPNLDVVVINHDKSGVKTQLKENELEGYLEKIEKNRSIVIAADKEIKYGEVVSKLDKIKQLGFNKVALMVNTKNL